MREDRLTTSGGAMRAYYERRAAEYDDWWNGTGRFADRDRPGWDAERDALMAALNACVPLSLSPSLGSAVAGQIFALRFIEQDQNRWPTPPKPTPPKPTPPR